MKFLLLPTMRIPVSVSLGILTFFLMPGSWKEGTGIIAAWDAGATFMIFSILVMMSRSGPEATLRRAQDEEPSNTGVLLFTIFTSLAGLGAITYGQTITQNMPRSELVVHTALSILGVFCAWFATHLLYSLHYAKAYYDETPGGEPGAFMKGLEFPGESDLVDYWDFVYYAFTIAMCYQTSDVTVSSAAMRRLTIIHAIVSFLYVLTILGLMVNILSNLI